MNVNTNRLTGGRVAFATAIVGLFITLAPAAASAASLYASSTGDDSGPNPCTSPANPCTIRRAVETVAAGTDDVTLADGTYSLSTQLVFPNAAIVVHGSPGVRPTISVATSTVSGAAVLVNGTLRDVSVEQTSTDPMAPLAAVELSDSNDLVERVYAHITNGSSFPFTTGESSACELNGTVRDSVCWASGERGIGARLNSGNNVSRREANIRNVTAIASGTEGTGLQAADRDVAGGGIINATNVIARGPVSGFDIETVGLSTIKMAYSNYSETQSIGGRIDDEGGNQTTAPVFRDAANGDFHQLSSSSGTVDKGTAGNLLVNPFQFPAAGTGDLDGQSRNIGSAPDIGADEFAPVAGKISARGLVTTVQGPRIGFSAVIKCDGSLSTLPSIVGTTAGGRIWSKSSVSASDCTDQPPASSLGFDSQTGTATGTFGPSAPGGRNGQQGTLQWSYHDDSPDTVQFILHDRFTNSVYQVNQQVPSAFLGSPGGVWTLPAP